MQNPNNGRRIAIIHGLEEGGVHVDAMTGTMLTPANERPTWADGMASALLAERVGWYESRLGKQLPEGLRSPNVIDFRDLGWVGVDIEGDEVEIEASGDFRSETLATILELSTDSADFDKIGGIEVAHTYSTHPTSEQTLAEAEGETFGAVEEQKTTATGA